MGRDTYYYKEDYKRLKNTEFKNFIKAECRPTIIIGSIVLLVAIVDSVMSLMMNNMFGMVIGAALLSASICQMIPAIKRPWLCMVGQIIKINYDENGDFITFTVKDVKGETTVNCGCTKPEKYKVGDLVYAYARYNSYALIIGHKNSLDITSGS